MAPEAALWNHAHKSSTAQDSEVVGQGRHADVDIEVPTDNAVGRCKLANDFESYRVAECIEHSRQLDRIQRRVFQSAHEAQDTLVR